MSERGARSQTHRRNALASRPSDPLLGLSPVEILRRPRAPKQFGGWRLDREAHCFIPDAAPWYAVPLERCRTSAQVLDWLAQIAPKRWATDSVLAGLVRILDDTLRLQARLCGGGVEHGPLDVRTLFTRGRR